MCQVAFDCGSVACDADVVTCCVPFNPHRNHCDVVLRSGMQVLDALLCCIRAPNAPPATRALSAILVTALQSSRLASLSAALARRLSDQLQSAERLSPAARSLLLRRCQVAAQVSCDSLHSAMLHVQDALTSTPTSAAGKVPCDRALWEVEHVLGDESGAESAALWVTSPATLDLPVLLTVGRWREQLLQAAQDVSALSALPCIEQQEGVNWELRVTILASLIQIAELVPVRLAQWFALAVGADMTEMAEMAKYLTCVLTDAPELLRAPPPNVPRAHPCCVGPQIWQQQ